MICVPFPTIYAAALNFFFFNSLILTCIFSDGLKVTSPLTLTYQLTFRTEPRKIDTGKRVKENQEQSNINVFASVQHFVQVRNVLSCPLELYACLS